MKKYKHYIVLISIFAITIIGCAYALKWHAVYKENKLNAAVIADYIHELKQEEFSNYISDNPFAVIYFGIPSDSNCRTFEGEFKEYIVKNNLRETIVYVNVDNLAGTDFANKFDAKYNTNSFRQNGKNLYQIPAIAVYNHTALVDFISNSNLKIDEVKKLLKKYNINGE
jgi:hypothetical protein